MLPDPLFFEIANALHSRDFRNPAIFEFFQHNPPEGVIP
jgi:hypothetical protein